MASGARPTFLKQLSLCATAGAGGLIAITQLHYIVGVALLRRVQVESTADSTFTRSPMEALERQTPHAK